MTSNAIGEIWAAVLVVAYLGATTLLLLTGAGRAGVPVSGLLLHLALLAAMVALTWIRRTPQWLRDWSPLIVLVLLYAELPLLIRAAGHHEMFDRTVMAWEQSLFAAQPARAWAAAVPWLWLSEPLHAAYLSYYAIIFAGPATLYLQQRRADFHEATLILMATFLTCFVGYLLFPVAGPRYVWAAGAGTGPMRSITLALLEAGSSKGSAFPSSHVAVSVTQTILAWHYFGARRGAVVAMLAAGLAVGAIYGGFHYAVDVVAGAVLGAGIAAAGLRMIARTKNAAPSGERERADVSRVAAVVRE